MEKKTDNHIFTGMNVDYDVTKHKPEVLVNARNIRLTSRGDNTLLAITNEQGTSEVIDFSTGSQVAFEGTYVGHCIVGEYLVVFTKESKRDRIYRCKAIDNSTNQYIIESPEILYEGDLNFSDRLETYGLYENANIQKVYWVDGINQARVINIVKDILNGETPIYDNNSFDFIQHLQLNEDINIKLVTGVTGIFPAGVVQYAFNYFNKYGQESNLAYTSPLYYTSFPTRGGSPEETISVGFNIIINNIDSRFEYLRLYSIVRTSQDTVPQVKIVKDFNIKNIGYLEYTDTNTEGSIIDPTALLYLGGEEIVPRTLTTKDNTMFLGNYDLLRPDLNDIKDFNPNTIRSANIREEFVDHTIHKEASTSISTIDDSAYSKSTIAVVCENPTMLTKSNMANYITSSSNINIDSDYLSSCDIKAKAGKILTGFRVHRNKGIMVEAATLTVYNAEGKKESGYNFTYGNHETIILEGNFDKLAPVADKIIVGVHIHGTWGENDDRTFTRVYLASIYCNGKKVSITPSRNIEFSEARKSNVSYTLPESRTTPDANEIFMMLQHRGGHTGQYLKYFMGKLSTVSITNVVKPSTNVGSSTFYPMDNIIDSSNDSSSNIPRGFKGKEWYRLGVQFQHVTGKWSEPCFIKDYQIKNYPKYNNDVLSTSSLVTSLNVKSLLNNGYVKARPVIVQPSLLYRTVIAQGILCPTVSSTKEYKTGTPHYQSSWFARVVPRVGASEESKFVGYYPQYEHNSYLHTSEKNSAELESNIPDDLIELSKTMFDIQTEETYDRFKVSYACQTFHSPDVEFNEDLWLLDYTNNYKLKQIGRVNIDSSAGDIYLSVKSPSLNNRAGGFCRNATYDPNGGKSLLCGAFYNGGMVNYKLDNGVVKYEDYNIGSSSVYFKIFPWHSSGSLCNDVARSDNGVMSSELKRKIISNIKYSGSTTINNSGREFDLSNSKLQVFHSDQVSLARVGGFNYYGNVDTGILSSYPSGNIFYTLTGASASSISIASVPSILLGYEKKSDQQGVYSWTNGKLSLNTKTTDLHPSMMASKSSIRMKYKSTPHYVVYLGDDVSTPERGNKDSLVLAEIYKNNDSSPYGREDNITLQSQIWIPAGDAVSINSNGSVDVEWKYGDTFYQRYDCLKTYPFTEDDENGIVDIVSFMCETRVNLGGRYDKNRGQSSNIYMRPTNFNLLNPVYNQADNYFNYHILDEDFYKIDKFDTDITWSLQKTNAEDVDKYTKTTLASTYSIDGNKGSITALETWNQHIYAFQEKGISEILFNSRVQIPVSEGNPIEITNSYKLDGNQYISDGLGCINKWSISNTPSGLYFIEHSTKELYHLGQDGLKDVSSLNAMSTWFKNNNVDRIWYDSVYNDLYINTEDTSLVFSEQTASFTSFMDYQESASMFNINKHFLAIHNNSMSLWSLYNSNKHCYIFNKYRPYGISLVSNMDAALNKIFNNMDIRGDWFTVDSNGEKFQTKDFFDTIRVYNEYQDSGDTLLVSERSKNNPLPNLAKKFRVWNIQLPRDNKEKDIKGKLKNRISNTWARIDLYKSTNAKDSNRMELHDLGVSYYI